jgi:AbrB-like transcriptional regulator
MSKKKKLEPLTGEELLQKVKEMESYSKEEKAKACGYFTQTKNGLERVNIMKFQNALIDAADILPVGKPGASRGGRSASYRISVQSNGNLLIGAAYTKQMELHAGDEFEITLGRKHIKLKQVDLDEEEE